MAYKLTKHLVSGPGGVRSVLEGLAHWCGPYHKVNIPSLQFPERYSADFRSFHTSKFELWIRSYMVYILKHM